MAGPLIKITRRERSKNGESFQGDSPLPDHRKFGLGLRRAPKVARQQRAVGLDPVAPAMPKEPLPLGPALRTKQALDLKRRIQRTVDGKIELTLTDNRAVMISVRRIARHRQYKVRLHHLFVDSPPDIVEHLSRYIAFDDQSASDALGRYIDDNDEQIREPASCRTRKTAIKTEGRVYDLKRIFQRLNRQYFDGQLKCEITWGKRTVTKRPRRTIKLGSYTVEDRLIRVHPGLDQDWVPSYYVEWVVFHEMLHAVLPIRKVNGRRRFHTPEFAAWERRFQYFEDASFWEKSNVAALLCI